MHDALRRFGVAIAAAVLAKPAFRTASGTASGPAFRIERTGPSGKPFLAAVALLLGAAAGGASAAGAEGPVTASAPAAAVMRGVSPECLSIGEIVEKIARWRDAGGAPQRAQAEIARRIADPDARAVAVSLVAQLYTGFARQMTPAQARDAYAASCALAQANTARPAAAPDTPTGASAPPPEAASAAASPARMP